MVSFYQFSMSSIYNNVNKQYPIKNWYSEENCPGQFVISLLLLIHNGIWGYFWIFLRIGIYVMYTLDLERFPRQ